MLYIFHTNFYKHNKQKPKKKSHHTCIKMAIIERRTSSVVRELNPAPCGPCLGVNLIHKAVIIIVTTTTIIIQNTGMTDNLPGRTQAIFLNLRKDVLSCELISLLKLLYGLFDKEADYTNKRGLINKQNVCTAQRDGQVIRHTCIPHG